MTQSDENLVSRHLLKARPTLGRSVDEDGGILSAEMERRFMTRHVFEVALEVTNDGAKRPFGERVRRAASAARGDLVCIVPAQDASGEVTEHGIVRLPQEHGYSLIAVHDSPEGLVLRDEAAIDEAVLAFAHSAVSVMEQIGADARLARSAKAVAAE